MPGDAEADLGSSVLHRCADRDERPAWEEGPREKLTEYQTKDDTREAQEAVGKDIAFQESKGAVIAQKEKDTEGKGHPILCRRVEKPHSCGERP